MQHHFIYYRVDAHAVADLAPRLRRMMDEVATATGAAARLMQRRDSSQATLLEVYEGIRDEEAFEAALSLALARARLPAQLQSQRRTERFGDL